jgi:predicted CXXCH cytochrome family protein
MRRSALIIAIVVVLLTVVGVAAYVAIVPGLSSARPDPSSFEVEVATYLLRHSVPASADARVNPLGAHPDPAAVKEGNALFLQKCSGCHAHDGKGQTEIGPHVLPRVPSLRVVTASLSDGAIFYHIRNGIRNTAMPAWNFSDRQTWELVSFIRGLPLTADPLPQDLALRQEAAVTSPDVHYVGSQACASCHQDIYNRWKKTRMANVLRDPKTHPDAFAADPATAPPELRFNKDDVSFIYGSKWKQRYWKKQGDTYVPLLAQYNIATKQWSKYHVPDQGGDWWAKDYPDPAGDNSNRPTGPLCDGCHSVNFNIETSKPAEWNVGCEQCHGAGSAHAAHPTMANILNPARQDYVHASDTCIACHSQGQPLSNPIQGKYYDWPVGYHAGLKLADFWKLEDHKLGETSFTHFPDGTAHKNRMQGNDFVQSLMYTRGVTCFSCHDPHGTDNDALLREPANQVCSMCHAVGSQNGPHAVSLEAHTHHKAGSAGSECVACHMPKILPQLPGGPFVSTHTFHFVTPVETDTMKIPNACNACHTDKDTKWAAAAIKGWSDKSPWRMQ